MDYLEISPEYTNIFKLIIQKLTTILYNVNIEFKYIEKDKRLILTGSDEAKICLINLSFNNFEKFIFKEKKEICINLINFNKHLNLLTDNDILTLFFEENNNNCLMLKTFNMNNIYKYKLYKINLCDCYSPSYDITFGSTEFDYNIIMSSLELKKICYELNQYKDVNTNFFPYFDPLNIQCFEDKIIFSDKSTSSMKIIIYKNKELIINTNTSQQYNGFFCFQTFMKLINFDFICDNIILNFKNDYPLIITYSSSFAELTACLNNLEN